MKVTGYKDKSGRMHWCVHTPRGLAPFAGFKDLAIEVAGGDVHHAMTFGVIGEWEFTNWRKVTSFVVEQRNAK